jgi:Fic family protein
MANMSARDDGDSISLFEPLMISADARLRSNLDDLALTLAEKSAAFSASLSPAITASLAEIVSITNSHYSNFIEGHNTSPTDIERAMHEEYSDDVKKHELQLEARAHITVQRWIDEEGTAAAPFSTKTICEVHRRFYELLPPEFLQGDTGKGDERLLVEPGAIRTRDVKVGRHLAISPGAIPRFLSRMEQGYRSSSRIDRILTAACGHHRLLWVHPFINGNGRVARFVSYAALKSVISGGALWSVARGLGRCNKEYKAHLQSCDEPRRGDLDGRGSLSEGALASFVEFFIQTCIHEVDFMSDLMQPNRILGRVLSWADEEVSAQRLPPGSEAVLAALAYRGELEMGEIRTIVGDRQPSARYVVPALITAGVVRYETTRSNVRLVFSTVLAGKFLPDLFQPDRLR